MMSVTTSLMILFLVRSEQSSSDTQFSVTIPFTCRYNKKNK
jgi:hypothetical protein